MIPYVDLLKAGKFSRASVYLLVGPDATIHQDVVQRLVRGLVQNPEFNYLRIVAADSTKADDIQAFGEEFPLLSPRRLLWIDGCDRLPAATRDALSRYLGERNPSTVLVLSSGQVGDRKKAASARKESSLEELAASQGVTVQCEIRMPRFPNDRTPDDRVAWLTMDMEKRGLSAAVDCRQALLRRLGSTLSDLRNEMDKLEAWLGARKDITKNDVEMMITPTVAASMPELSHLLQRRQTDALLRLYRQLVAGGAAPFQILNYVGAILRPHASRSVLEALTATEVAAKSGTDPDLAVELLLLQVCHSLESTEPVVLRPRR